MPGNVNGICSNLHMLFVAVSYRVYGVKRTYGFLSMALNYAITIHTQTISSLPPLPLPPSLPPSCLLIHLILLRSDANRNSRFPSPVDTTTGGSVACGRTIVI